MGNKIILDEKYLEATVEFAFRSLVGEQMKRFEKFIEEEDNSKKTVPEIVRDLSKIKKACKELTWEKYRELRDTLKAFDKGVKFIVDPKLKKS